MLWLTPTWIATCIAMFFLGYHLRGLTKKIEHLEEVIQTKVSRKVVEEPKSVVIDPDDAIQEALYQHKIMMDKLNGQDR